VRCDLFQHFQPLDTDAKFEERKAGGVAARLRQARDEAGGDKYNKAVACLTKDREALLAFFDFAAEHWDHLRTSNPIESALALRAASKTLENWLIR
jgi:transposase-like protein